MRYAPSLEYWIISGLFRILSCYSIKVLGPEETKTTLSKAECLNSSLSILLYLFDSDFFLLSYFLPVLF